MKKKFDRNLFGLLSNSAMHNIISIYMNTFLVAHLLNINQGNFFILILLYIYYVISYIVLLFSYFIFSLLASKFNKSKLVEISVVLSCLILIYMASLGYNLSSFIVPFSLLFNIVSGMYWSSINALSNEIIKGKRLQSYNTYSSIVSNLTSIIVPIAFGSIIDSSSLSVISIFVVIVGILEIIATFFIKTPTSSHKLNYKEYFNEAFNGTNNKCFKLLYVTFFANGARGAIGTLITMLIVLTFKTNTSLGAISSILSIMTILVLLISNKIKNKKMEYSYLVITLSVLLSMILLEFNINKITIIIFNFAIGSLMAIVDRAASVKRSGIIRAINHKEYIVEHQSIMEIFLNLGRIFYYSILLIASSFTDLWIYKLLLGFSMIIVLIYGLLNYYLEKEYRKILIEREYKKQLLSNDPHDLLLTSY